jgi:hypothetical protein
MVEATKLIDLLRAASVKGGMCDVAADLIEQQAARLTALESERDALLAAAGKEAVAIYQLQETRSAGRPWVDTTKEWAEMRASEGKHEMRVVYTAPTAALENGDGRDAEPVAWFHNTARKGDKPVYEQVAEEFSCYPAIPLYSGPVEPIYCQACGDGITAHDPGICGNCFAMKHSGSALAMLKRIPTTPEQMIDFIGSHFNSMEAQEWSEFSGDAVAKPAGDLSMVRYSLTVHDLLSAFDWADLSADAIDAALSQKAGEQQ